MVAILIRLALAALFTGLAALVGAAASGYPGLAWGTALGGWIVLAYHIHVAQKIMAWAKDLRLDHVPDVSGWWEELVALIYRHLRLQQRQQQALNNALVSFREAAQALPDGVVTMEGDYRINWCNETSEDHLSIKLTTDIGQPLINLVRQPEFSAYLANRQWDKPLIMRAPTQTNRVLSIQVISYGDHQMLLLTRDITQVEKLENMRRDFVANVSHELKTPLTVLSGFLETLRELPLSPTQQAEYLKLMSDQAYRMERLVEDLLTLSSLESGSKQPLDEDINMGLLVTRLKVDAKGLSGGQHPLTFDCDGDLHIKGAEAELFSAFSNLVSNAIRYTPKAGAITVRWGTDEQGNGRFSVQDSGIGIEPQHIPRLTERFYRVDRSRSRESGGTGLGLAIVKHVLTRHGGYLDIKSELGKGSLFIAVIPKHRLNKGSSIPASTQAP